MSGKARGPVTIDAHLYNDLTDFLTAINERRANAPSNLHNRLAQALLADSCMDDGEYGECSTHEDTIEYWVDNFGPEGKVISLGRRAPDGVDTCFPVCPGAQEYRYDIVVEVGASATVEGD